MKTDSMVLPGTFTTLMHHAMAGVCQKDIVAPVEENLFGFQNSMVVTTSRIEDVSEESNMEETQTDTYGEEHVLCWLGQWREQFRITTDNKQDGDLVAHEETYEENQLDDKLLEENYSAKAKQADAGHGDTAHDESALNDDGSNQVLLMLMKC
uniref:Uncharacterized protein n=1 Tax=Oryza punctata TaxID=4537 RepID=A0A0E0LBY3_ORYPU